MSTPWLGNWSSASQYSQTEVTGSMHGQTLQMHGFVGIAGLSESNVKLLNIEIAKNITSQQKQGFIAGHV